MSHAIPGMGEVAIRCILPPGLIQCRKIALNFLSRDTEQRARKRLLALPRCNARESARAGAAYHTHQHRFRLVVESVRGRDFVCLALSDQLGEPPMPQIAGRRLQAELVLLCMDRSAPCTRVKLQ